MARDSLGNISIHAPREGGDHGYDYTGQSITISIHAPREGGDAASKTAKWLFGKFQSTPPARGATINKPTRMNV